MKNLLQKIIPAIIIGLFLTTIGYAATLIYPYQGGTGIGSYTTGDIIYSDATDSLTTLGVCANGQIIKYSGGVPACGTDTSGGAGGSGVWASSTDNLLIYPTDTNDVVVIGANATTTTGYIFEVIGSSLFDNINLGTGKNLTVGTTQWNTGDSIDGEQIANDTIDDDSIDLVDITLIDFTNDADFLTWANGTSTYLSLTAWHATTTDAITEGSTNKYFATSLVDSHLSGGTGITYSSGAISFDCSEVEGTGINCVSEAITLDATGDWTGTLDGYQGADLTFSTTTNDYWASQKNVSMFINDAGYLTTSDWSTTSVNYWLTTKDTGDLTEGTNLYFTNQRAADYISSSSSVPHIACSAGEILEYSSGWVCGTDDTGAGAGSNWSFSSANAISPTTTVGLIVNASSTFVSDLTVHGTFASANSSNWDTAYSEVNASSTYWDNAYNWKNSAIDASDRLKMAYGGTEADLSAITTGGLMAGTGAGALGVLNVGTWLYPLIASSTASEGMAWQKLDISSGSNLSVASPLTISGDEIQIINDEIGDTQLAYNTGQHLTSTSYPTFSGVNLTYGIDVATSTITTMTGASTDVSCSECLIIGTEVKAGTLTDTKLCIWDDGNGQIVCNSDDANTTYTASNPLTLAGTVFGIENASTTRWETAYNHSQDNTQAHSDYFLNSGSDIAGAGSGFTWGFNASAGSDCVMTFGDGTINVSTGALQVGGSAVLTASPFGADIGVGELTTEDFGDFTVAAGAATLDTGVVGDNEIDYSNVTLADFDYQTAWRVFYSDTNGDITELALGTAGQYLKSAGAAAAPIWDTPSGSGDITDVFNCASGDCSAIVMGAADSLDCGAGVLEIPQDGTIDATGELTWETTTSTLRIYDGTTKYVLSPVFEKSFWLASTTDDKDNNSFNDATSTFELWNPAKRVVLTGLYAKTDTGTVCVACGDGTNWTETIAATSSGVEDDGSMTNNTFIIREDFQCKVGSAVTTPSKVTVTCEFRYAGDD